MNKFLGTCWIDYLGNHLETGMGWGYFSDVANGEMDWCGVGGGGKCCRPNATDTYSK